MKVKYIRTHRLNEGFKMPTKINHIPIDSASDNSKREITVTKKDILNMFFNTIKELIYDAIDDVINGDVSSGGPVGDEEIYFIFAKKAESYDQDGRVTIRNIMNSIDKKGDSIFVYMTFVSAYDNMQTIYLGDCALKFMQFIDKIHDAIVDVYPNARLKLYQEVMGSFDNLKTEFHSNNVRCITNDNINDSLDLYREHIAVHRNSSKSMFGFPKNDYMIKKYLEGNRTTNEIPMFIECCSDMTFSHLLNFINKYGLNHVYCTDYHNPANYIQFTLNYNIYQMEKYVNLNDFLNKEFAGNYIGQILCAGVFVDLSKYSKDECAYLHNKYCSYNISCLSTYSDEPYIWFYLGEVNKSTSKSFINKCSEKMGNILLPETIEKCVMSYDNHFRGFLYYPISNKIFLVTSDFSNRKDLSDELQK